jgi:hypothetical protein
VADGKPTPTTTAASAVVLQLKELPGLLPPGGRASVVPVVTVYGDGRVVAADTQGVRPPRLTTRLLARAEVERVLHDVQRADLPLADGAAGGQVGPDAPTATLTVADSAGVRVLSVRRDEAATRVRQRLVDLSAGGEPYGTDRVAVIAVASGTGGRPWPAGELATGSATRDGARCVLLSGAAAAAAVRAVGGVPGGSWSSGGVTYSVTLRPLLPDERSCADLER